MIPPNILYQNKTLKNTLPNKLNDYYYMWFDKCNVSSPFFTRNGYTTAPFNISMRAAKTKLLNEQKAKGPDAIMLKLLKTCADQLGEVYTFIFNWSL